MASFIKIANHRIISLTDGFNPEQRSSYLKLPPNYQTSCWDAHHSPQCVVSLTEMNNKLSLLSYNIFLVVSGWRSERVAYTKGLKFFFSSLLSTHQSGFQPHQATETALQCHQWLLADQIQWSIPSAHVTWPISSICCRLLLPITNYSLAPTTLDFPPSWPAILH